MKYRWKNKYLYWGITIFSVIAASLVFYYLLFHGANLRKGFVNVRSIFMPIIDGFALAYLLTPIVNFIEQKIMKPFYRKAKIPVEGKARKRMRVYAIIFTFIFVGIVVYEFFSTVIPEIINSIQSIVLQFPIYVRNLTTWGTEVLSKNPYVEEVFTDIFEKYSMEFEKWFNQSVLPQVNIILRNFSLGIIGFLKALYNFIIGLILSFYILNSKELFAGQCKKIVYAILEQKRANEFINNVRFTHRTFSGFLGGKIVDSIIIGILCFIGTSIMGTPYAVLISVIVGVTNVIPFFGPYLGAIPSAILILMVNPLQCLYFIIFILILQQFDGNVLGPKILGDSTGLSGFWVIFSIMVFGGFFGVFGMFIGVPAFAVIYAAFRSYCNRKLIKKGLPQNTEQYTKVAHIRNDEFVDMSEVPKSNKKKDKTGKKDTTNSIYDGTKWGEHEQGNMLKLTWEDEHKCEILDEDIVKNKSIDHIKNDKNSQNKE